MIRKSTQTVKYSELSIDNCPASADIYLSILDKYVDISDSQPIRCRIFCPNKSSLISVGNTLLSLCCPGACSRVGWRALEFVIGQEFRREEREENYDNVPSIQNLLDKYNRQRAVWTSFSTQYTLIQSRHSTNFFKIIEQ